jgi:hypothetical protein
LRAKSNLSSRIKLICAVQSLPEKYSDFQKVQISVEARPVLPGKRGVSRSSRNAGWDAVDAMAAQDERRLSRTAKPCGPDASMAGVKFSRSKLLGGDGDNKARFSGESAL